MEAKFQEKFQTFFDSYTIFCNDVVSAINASNQRMSTIQSSILNAPSTQEAKKKGTDQGKYLTVALLGNDKTKPVVKKETKEETTCFDESD
jgi:hypothetical protein